MRLKVYQRERIVSALVDRKFSAEKEALDACEKDLALDFYRDHIPLKVEALADELNKVHPGLVNMNTWIGFRIGGKYHQLQLDRSRPISNDDWTWDNDHVLAERFAKLELDKADYKVRRKKATDTATATLESFTTVRKVESAWPEVMPIVREILGDQTPVTLPALPTAELNAMFDLPVEQQVAA